VEVIDSNVALYAFSAAPMRGPSERLLALSRQLIAPDIFHGECANVLARLVRIRKMTEAGARGVLTAIRSMVKSTVATDPLVGRAFDLALQLNHRVFDCLYLEVARSEGARLVTADARFVAKLRGTSDASLIVHLADWTP
jgi:predicted nucleic acid-binding protein